MRHTSQIEALPITSTQFHPIGTQFLALYEEKTQSDGGILYASPEDTWWSTVVVAGPDCEVLVGERVLMEPYRGENIDMLDGKFVLLDEKQGLAVESV